MLGRVFLMAALAGCAAASPHLPDALRTCPTPAEAPPKLGRLVTPETLRLLYWRERSARLEDENALEVCASRLARVLEVIKQ